MVIEQHFEEIVSDHGHKIKVIPLIDLNGNQSIQLLLPCGCFQVDHILSQKEMEFSAEHMGYYEFCAQHPLTVQKN